jgi:8-oxo-dGTP diphosphatase
MSRALLVRHARAGDREAWEGDQRLRPLDKRGRRQAEAIAATLADFGVDRLVSSPHLRCLQTLEPASARLGLPIEERDELTEGARRDEALALVHELAESLPALCTHGDVIYEVVGRPCKKGAVWVVEVRSGAVLPERYLPPS